MLFLYSSGSLSTPLGSPHPTLETNSSRLCQVKRGSLVGNIVSIKARHHLLIRKTILLPLENYHFQVRVTFYLQQIYSLSKSYSFEQMSFKLTISQTLSFLWYICVCVCVMDSIGYVATLCWSALW